MDHRRIQEGPAQRIKRLQPCPGPAVGQMHRPHPGGEAQRLNRTAAEAGQLRPRQLPVHHRLELDPGALTALPLVAMPLVAVNQKDGGNHGASNAGPRRVPCRRSRARDCPDRRASARHQRAASLPPALGAARTMEGPAAAAAISSGARAAAQSIQSDSAPHCSRSSSARCSTERTGTRRHGRTGWAAASRNQIRAQPESSLGGWCSMPTELIEEGVGMAALAEDSQTRPRPGATQGRLCQQGITTTEEPGGHPKAPTGGTPGATGLSRRAVRLHLPSSCLRSESCGSMSGFTTRTPRQLKPWWRSSVSSRRAPPSAATLSTRASQLAN